VGSRASTAAWGSALWGFEHRQRHGAVHCGESSMDTSMMLWTMGSRASKAAWGRALWGVEHRQQHDAGHRWESSIDSSMVQWTVGSRASTAALAGGLWGIEHRLQHGAVDCGESSIDSPMLQSMLDSPQCTASCCCRCSTPHSARLRAARPPTVHFHMRIWTQDLDAGSGRRIWTQCILDRAETVPWAHSAGTVQGGVRFRMLEIVCYYI